MEYTISGTEIFRQPNNFSLLASWFMKKCDNLCLPSIEATFCIPTRAGQWAHATTVRRRITAKYDVQIPF